MRFRSELRWLLSAALICAALCVTTAVVSASGPAVPAVTIRIKKSSGPGELPPPLVPAAPQQNAAASPPTF